MTPKVSICVPNLNTRPFLPERFQTIFEQSLQDWELLVYDSYSEDGAWEYIRGLAEREPRMRAWQGPRQGTPGSWSPCVRQAAGEYVYIATSDDTMPRDCLAKLVAALESHPECDLAHCRLRAIDQNGHDTPDWWSGRSMFARSSGPLLHRPHLRRAPFDGLLHWSGESVYISITQLLIRRSLFDRIGLFESRWGSIGDFNWSMRAGLVAHTVHVPDTWGGWRVHPNQATAGAGLGSNEHSARIEDMIEHALQSCEQFLAPPVRQWLKSTWSPRAREIREFFPEVRRREGSARRKAFVLGRLLAGSWVAREYVARRLRGQRFLWPESAPELIRDWLEQAGAQPVLAAL